MEEFLLHHCVTSDNEPIAPSSWQPSGRAECVLLQENRLAHGASRVILSKMLELALQSAKTSDVLLLTLDSPDVAKGVTSNKLTHVDYSDDADNFQESTNAMSSLLTNKVLRDIEAVETKAETRRGTGQGMSSRPVVVILDSLNALLQQTSLHHVLLFLRQLRGHQEIGSVIARLNASAELPEVAQALAAQATAVVLVETRSSLRAYPLLSKERRREVPQGMHGFVMLVRQKKNGRSSESIEYFHIQGRSIHLVSAEDIEVRAIPAATDSKLAQKPRDTKTNKNALHTQGSTTPTASLQSDSSQAPLPVRQEEVSFNLSISNMEQQAKNQVQLPYMHQGLSSGNNTNNTSQSAGPAPGNNALFFIDEDDPDWDDDDLDDDLDI